jgi:riboflavin biosynthesis pyrimidine reductase
MSATLDASAGRLGRVQHLDDLSDDELAELYAYPPASELSLVRANFISTLDGAATGDDGRTASINDPADHRVFALLRAVSDVILVGAGTARDEGYGRARTRERLQPLRASLGLADHPTIAVVSRSLELPDALLDESEGSGGLVVVTTQDADPLRLAQLAERLGQTRLLLCGRGSVDLVTALERLAGMGFRRVLTEGGPQLMNDLTRADLVDELCLTIAPLLVGGHSPRIGAGAPYRRPLRLAHAVTSDSSLLTRWTRP